MYLQIGGLNQQVSQVAEKAKDHCRGHSVGKPLPPATPPQTLVQTHPKEASTVRYWLICSMAASSSVWMLRRLCSRASRCCRSWPSRARSSSGVSPAKPAGGTGIGGKAGERERLSLGCLGLTALALQNNPEWPNLPKGGGSGMPIQGGGKGKPGAGLASGAGLGPGAGAEGGAAAVVLAAPLGRERAAEEQAQESSEC